MTLNRENKKTRKLQEYQERYRFWSDKRISQLSFHNNLLLTLGIAIIGYFWKERDSIYKDLIFDFSFPISWKILLFFLGMIAIFFSIFFGFLLSISRLYDLRLTSNILYVRKMTAQKGHNVKNECRTESSFFTSMRSLWSIFWFYRKSYEVTDCHIANTVELKKRFSQLRQKTKDLGISTWGLMQCQTVCMFFAMVFFVIVLFMK